jgi:hypothetical protein
MKQTLILSFFAILFLFSSCSSTLDSFSEYDKSTDFIKYRSYAWLAPDTSIQNKNINAEKIYGKMIIAYSNEELKKKGMVIDNANPDAVFRYSFGVNNKIEYKQAPTVSVGVAYADPFYYAAAAVPVAGGQITEKRADEVFLVIEMLDTKTGYVIWTSGTRRNVDNTGDTHKNMKLALQSIFSSLKIKHKVKK